jgi:D-alanyl-D-alanine carboxypeptidase/D-alanyl-D-alanine-endopeptidase (penicillin-binding protein 4)
VNLQPFNPVVRIVNTCKTTASGLRRDLAVKKDLDQNVLEISGTMPVGDRGFNEPVAVSHPAELFVALLRQRLEQKGVVVTGQTRVVGVREKANLAAASTVAPVQIAQTESPPFSLIAAKTMKPSQNMYTETILWTLGEQLGNKTNSRASSADRGIAVVKEFLYGIGVAADGIIQYDGSGLSRHNLVTPAALVTLYSYMAKQSRYSAAWLDSLTIGGTDGTLRGRFKGARTNGNVRGKTGTIDQVSALSGYVTTAAGEKMVFSVIVNGVGDNGLRVSTIDQIVGHVANFDGRVN